MQDAASERAGEAIRRRAIGLRERRAADAAIAACLTAALASCVPSVPEGLDSPFPQQQLEAAVSAAERRDQDAVPKLVALLDSDDPAVRLVAIESLERITGERLGYDYAADQLDRDDAVERWQAWVTRRRASGADGGTTPDEGRDRSGGGGGVGSGAGGGGGWTGGTP